MLHCQSAIHEGYTVIGEDARRGCPLCKKLATKDDVPARQVSAKLMKMFDGLIEAIRAECDPSKSPATKARKAIGRPRKSPKAEEGGDGTVVPSALVSNECEMPLMDQG